jgi:CheY-like chemotaxis protein
VNQIVFTQALEQTPYSFKIVGNGRLALLHWEKLKPSLILMDVSMPEMNGHEATMAIRAREVEGGLARTPIVGITAHALKGDPRKMSRSRHGRLHVETDFARSPCRKGAELARSAGSRRPANRLVFSVRSAARYSRPRAPGNLRRSSARAGSLPSFHR